MFCFQAQQTTAGKPFIRPAAVRLAQPLPGVAAPLFQHSKANVFVTVDGYVRRRLRSLLQKRRGRTSQGLGAAHQRWSNEWFARHGLLSLKAAHEWTRIIVKLRTH